MLLNAHLRQGWKRTKKALKRTKSATKFIAIAMAIIFVVDVVWSSLSSWSGLIPMLASIGGMVVFFGLWIEKESDEEEKLGKIKFLTPKQKWLKFKSEFGWWVLMAGIGIEIIVAVVLALLDISEKSALNSLNLPISDISAVVEFKVKARNLPLVFDWKPTEAITKSSFMMLCESNQITNTNIIGFFSGTHLNTLMAGKPEIFFDGNILDYVLEFRVWAGGSLWLLNDSRLYKTVGWALKNVRVLDIHTRLLPLDTKILGGSAVVKINDRQMLFIIPSQNNVYSNSFDKSGLFEFIAWRATNASDTLPR